MNRFSLAMKITSVIAMLIAIICGISYLGLSELSSLNGVLKNITDVTARKIQYSGDISKNMGDLARLERNMILTDEDGAIASFANRILESRKKLGESIASFETIIDNEALRQRIQSVKEKLSSYYSLQDQVIELSKQNSNVKAKVLSIGKAGEASRKLQEAFRDLSNSAEESFRKVQNQNDLDLSLLASRSRSLVLNMMRLEKNAILSTNENEMKNFVKEIENFDEDLKQRLQSIRAIRESRYNELRSLYEDWSTARNQVLQLTLQNSNSKAFLIATGEARAISEEIGTMLEEIAKNSSDQLAEMQAYSAAAYESSKAFVIISAVIGTLASTFLAFIVVFNIKRSLTNVADALSEGSEQVAAAAGQIAEASQQISEMATQQASSTEESSAAIEEMSGMMSANVDSAEKANHLTEEMRKIASDGNASMARLVSSMDEILKGNEKIQELVKIIGEIGEKTEVIDEIVFQTKLLSFNASVEAERAGEHGRGFAVVAQEVGNLAQLSGKAALEISSIVKESIKTSESIITENKQKVEQGNNLAKETARFLQTITSNAETVSEHARQILDASRDQSSGIKQVNQAIAELDSAGQQNASTAEEAASSSEELTAQAKTLKELVDQLLNVVNGSKSVAMGQAQLRSNYRVEPHRVYQKPETKGKVLPITKKKVSSLKSSFNHDSRKAVVGSDIAPSSEHHDSHGSADEWDKL